MLARALLRVLAIGSQQYGVGDIFRRNVARIQHADRFMAGEPLAHELVQSLDLVLRKKWFPLAFLSRRGFHFGLLSDEAYQE
jgi:hypothetical protein